MSSGDTKGVTDATCTFAEAVVANGNCPTYTDTATLIDPTGGHGHQYPIGNGGSCDGLAVDKGCGISISRTVSIRPHGLRKSARRIGGKLCGRSPYKPGFKKERESLRSGDKKLRAIDKFWKPPLSRLQCTHPHEKSTQNLDQPIPEMASITKFSTLNWMNSRHRSKFCSRT
jgi:hypothetical protein